MSEIEQQSNPVISQSAELLPPCSVGIKCADDLAIERCLDSIDDDVFVHVVMTPSDRIKGILNDRGIDFSMTDYGNIARSAQLSVERSPSDNVIVMDSDAWFTPGSIRNIREALLTSVVAKPLMRFETDGYISEVIARARHAFYNRSDFATCPGLAMRKAELTETCGQIFNPLVRWTEDADLNFRMKKAGVSLALVTGAQIVHEPVSLPHELRAAFYYGIGKRLSVEHTEGRETPEEFPDFVINAIKAPLRVRENLQSSGPAGLILDTAWQAIYLTGYHVQRKLGRWTISD